MECSIDRRLSSPEVYIKTCVLPMKQHILCMISCKLPKTIVLDIVSEALRIKRIIHRTPSPRRRPLVGCQHTATKSINTCILTFEPYVGVYLQLSLSLSLSLYIYTYIYIYTYVCIYIYIYTYVLYIYIYIYICIHTLFGKYTVY